MKTMKARTHPRAAVLALATLVAGTACAQAPSWGGSISLRGFVNRASGVGFQDEGWPEQLPTGATTNSDTTTSLLPSVSLRFGSLVINGSYHLATDYKSFVPEAYDQVVSFRRREWDMGAGYAVLPNLVVSAGWKQVEFTGVSGNARPALPMTFAGPFVGVAASASMAPSWSAYGSVAVGRSKLSFAGTQVGRNGDYLASEVGVRWAMDSLGTAFRGAGLLAGYRTQSWRYKEVPFLMLSVDDDGQPLVNPSRRTVRQGVDGLTFGIAYSF